MSLAAIVSVLQRHAPHLPLTVVQHGPQQPTVIIADHRTVELGTLATKGWRTITAMATDGADSSNGARA